MGRRAREAGDKCSGRAPTLICGSTMHCSNLLTAVCLNRRDAHTSAGDKAPLATAKVSSLDVSIKGCSGNQVGVQGNLLAGILRIVKGKAANGRPVKVTKLGAPKGMELQVIPEAGSWPPADKSCVFKLPSAVASGKERAFKYGVCGPCLRCLDSMGFSCAAGGGKLRLRVRATAASSSPVYGASEWSDDLIFTPVCEPAPSGC
jgi:hypothetical protein